MHSLRGRIILSTIAGTVIALLVTGVAVLWVFDRSLDEQLENHLTAHADIVAGAIKITDDGIQIDEGSRLLRAVPRHWQIDTPAGTLAKSPLLSGTFPVLKPVTFSPRRLSYRAGDGRNIIAIQQAFHFPRDRTVILTFGLDAAIAQAFKDRLQDRLSGPILYVLGGIGILFGVIGLLQAAGIVRPLRRVTAALHDVRAGTSQRIDGAFPDEIQTLSDEINRLLAHISQILDRHQTVSGNLAHALKTPLTVIRNEAATDADRERIDMMLRLIDRNLARAQAGGSVAGLYAVTPVDPLVRRIADSFAKVHGATITIDGPADLNFRGLETDLFEILGNVIENACKFARATVQVQLQEGAVIVEDDGPGIPAEARSAVLNRGTRLDEAVTGAGIGLSVTQEIVTLYGGALRLEDSSLGGLKVHLELPISR